ncbi:MAG: hypothetical protein ACRD2C_04665 [Acidimicrobiales bacterium]
MATIRERLDAYSGGLPGLRRLTSEVEGLLGLLSGEADDEWIQELQSQWWNFEFVLSMAEGQSDLTVKQLEQVGDAVAQMKLMLAEYEDPKPD